MRAPPAGGGGTTGGALVLLWGTDRRSVVAAFKGRVLKSPHVAARKRPGVRSRRCSCPGPCEHLFATPIVGAAGAYRRVQVPGRLGTRTSRHLIAISLRNARKGAGSAYGGDTRGALRRRTWISCGAATARGDRPSAAWPGSFMHLLDLAGRYACARDEVRGCRRTSERNRPRPSHAEAGVSPQAAVAPPARLSMYLGGQSGYSSLRHARGSSDSAFGVRWSRNE